jgi:hypothetical protein
MNPPELETDSENLPGNKSWRHITRAELYPKVWSEPMVKIAREFGISDRGLAKTSKRLDVPVPPRGYWAKLQAGKEVSKLPLMGGQTDDDDGDRYPSNPSAQCRTRTCSTGS